MKIGAHRFQKGRVGVGACGGRGGEAALYRNEHTASYTSSELKASYPISERGCNSSVAPPQSVTEM